jgi:hypothetical protein
MPVTAAVKLVSPELKVTHGKIFSEDMADAGKASTQKNRPLFRIVPFGFKSGCARCRVGDFK